MFQLSGFYCTWTPKYPNIETCPHHLGIRSMILGTSEIPTFWLLPYVVFGRLKSAHQKALQETGFALPALSSRF